jgi:hypothetical protein
MRQLKRAIGWTIQNENAFCFCFSLFLFNAVHAKNTENTDGQKNEIQRKNKENNYSRPKFGTKKKLYFENTGTEGSVFCCIFSNTTGKYLYWHAQVQ